MELSKYIRDYFQNDFNNKYFGVEYKTTIGFLKIEFEHNSSCEITEREVSDEIHALIESGGIFSFLINSNGFYFPATQTEFEKHRRSKVRQSKKLINECVRLNSLNFYEFTKSRKEAKDVHHQKEMSADTSLLE